MRNLLLLFVFLPVFSWGQATEANLLFNWNDPSIIGSFAFNNAYNEIWGYAADGREYAIIGSTAGTHVFDVTDPANSTQIHLISNPVTGGSLIHRDYHDHEGYLYIVADEGPSTLQIVDLSGLPQTVNVVYDSNERLVRAHNIFIDENRCKMYTLFTAGGDTNFNPMRVYSLEDPANPTLLGAYSSIGGFSLSGGVHDAFIRNDTAYLNVGNTGFCIVDFSDTDNPALLGTLTTYVDQGYNHSGWLDDSGNYYYMADETHGMDIKVVDVSNPAEMEVVGTINAESSESASIPHNLIVACDKLYVSYYYDGLQVYDLADPENPVRMAYYDTYPGMNDNSYRGAWGVYPLLPSGNVLVSDMQTGLYIFEGYDTDCKPVVDLNCGFSVSSPDPIELDFSGVISPNPASSYVNLSLNLPREIETDLRLTDLTGKQIFVQEGLTLYAGENDFDFQLPDSIENGIYLLSFSSVPNQTFKLVVAK